MQELSDFTGFKDFQVEEPPIGIELTIKYNGRHLDTKWLGVAWELDPSGSIMPRWWKLKKPSA